MLTAPHLIDDYAGTYADTPEIEARADEGMVSTDFLLRYACRKLAIDCRGFPEFFSQYRGWVKTSRPDGFAFTHPHKEHAARHPLRHAASTVAPLAVTRWLKIFKPCRL